MPILAAAVLATTVALTTPAGATTKTTACGVSKLWSAADAWEPAGVPGPTDDVAVECPIDVVGTTTSVSELVVEPRGRLRLLQSTMVATGAAYIAGPVTLGDSTLRLYGQTGVVSTIDVATTDGLSGLLELNGPTTLPGGTAITTGSSQGLVRIGGSVRFLDPGSSFSPPREPTSASIAPRVEVSGTLVWRGTLRVPGGLRQAGGSISGHILAGSQTLDAGTLAARKIDGKVTHTGGTLDARETYRIGSYIGGGSTRLLVAPREGTQSIGTDAFMFSGALVVDVTGIDDVRTFDVVQSAAPIVSGPTTLEPSWVSLALVGTTLRATVVPAPSLRERPTVSPLPARAGRRLTASPGVWLGAPTVARQWLRCDPACVPIPGASRATFVPRRDDVGAALAYEVRGWNAAGELVERLEPVPVLPAARLVAGKRPALIGKAGPGFTLRCTRGTWPRAGLRFTRAWLRDGKTIPGARTPSYRLRPRDAGHRIACRVTAIDTTYGARGVAASAIRRVAR